MISYIDAYQTISTQFEAIQAARLSTVEIIKHLSTLLKQMDQLKVEYNKTFKAGTNPDLEQKLNSLYSRILGVSNQLEHPYLWMPDKSTVEPQKLNFRQLEEIKEPFLLQKGYKRIMYIRGDGDCFYRAIYLHMINQGLFNPALLERLKAKIEALLGSDEQLNRDIIGVLEALNLLKNEDPKKFLDLCATNQTIDQGLVRIYRKITADYILEHPKDFLREDAYNINRLGQYAEESAFAALAKALNLTIHIVIKDPVPSFKSYGTGSTPVDIYLHGEHFDILIR